MNIAIIAITTGGKALAQKIAYDTPYTVLDSEDKVADKLRHNWQIFDGFIMIMATGIVVRSIAPLLSSKREDPAIVVTDEAGKNAISLLSGHLGGANKLAHDVAQLTGGTAIITTASDTLGYTALDLWARENKLMVADTTRLTEKSALLVNRGYLMVYQKDSRLSLPQDLREAESASEADILISYSEKADAQQLVLHPKTLVLGTGCRKETPLVDYQNAFADLCRDMDISPLSIAKLCSIDAKKNEPGLLAFALSIDLLIEFYPREEINTFADQLTHSAKALEAVGAIGVAEPTALLGASQTTLYCTKKKWKNITMALASSTL